MHACSHSLWIGSEATLGEAKIPISDGARASGCLLTESISRERERERARAHPKCFISSRPLPQLLLDAGRDTLAMSDMMYLSGLAGI